MNIPIKLVPQNNPFLHNKKCELTMTLFTHCNLNCGFCYYKDYEKFKPYPEMDNIVLANFQKAVEGIYADRIEVSILGGELFQDQFSDDVFRQYENILNGCIAILEASDKQYEIKVMSNLIFHKTDRLINLIKNKKNTYLQVSYDPTNRFPKQYHVDLWFKNFEMIRAAGINVAVLMVDTKPNVLSILDENGENHQKTMQLFSDTSLRIDVTPYHMDTSDPNSTGFKCDDELMKKFNRYMIDNFPHILPYQKYMQLALHQTSAEKMADKCSSENVNMFYKGFVTANYSTISCCDRKKTISNYYKSHGCLNCKHFEYCFQECYYYDQYSKCILTDTFDYILQKNGML